MRDFLADLQRLEEAGSGAIRAAAAIDRLEEVRVEILGRKARLTQLLRSVRDLPPEHRRTAGSEANRVKQRLQELLEQRTAELTADQKEEGPEVDLTLPGRPRWRGARHPCTLVTDEICGIFKELGFVRARGPEAETTWYNFTALNTPLDHPAADEQDTFYLDADVVLRTHTSPVQARVMEKTKPPVRIVVPGVVYRRDPFDASHAPAFDQIEGLAVDEGINFVEFKATIGYFVRRFFGEDTATRFRPSFFPFTEPSAELDVSCAICHGEGCSACKGTGWVEIMGAGMVDPAVFDNVGYDSERYTGYAFGMGVGRIAMLRYRIPDIRLLYEGDVRFLGQFARA
ncbi:MAG: phenylalanine--tRNA ligase subunit alpha [Gemmatimonadota bacterium]|nr:MAG: phenylalanine--tRNA ligase subunit alpha [Gemmatimonadota bacterium]